MGFVAGTLCHRMVCSTYLQMWGGGGCHLFFAINCFSYSLIDIRLLKYGVYIWGQYLVCVGSTYTCTGFVVDTASVNSIISWYHLQSSVWDNYDFKPSMITISARAAHPHL